MAPERGRGERFVLAVDLGSTALKVGLVSLTGQIAWWDHTTLQSDNSERGSLTQDADVWWQMVASGARRGLAESSVRADDVVAVSVTGQWASTIPVDASGRPVGPCVMYTDSRGEPHTRPIFGGRLEGFNARVLATWLRHSGGIPSPYGTEPVGHMLHLSRDHPDIAAAARWYLEPVDYLSMRFTGRAAATHASMVASWLTDNRRLDVLAYDERLVELAQVESAKLPPLVPTGSVLGTVQPAVAGELGLSPNTVVVTGVGDLHASAIGVGCVQDYDTHMGIGTTSWISYPLRRKKVDLFRQMTSVPGLSNNSYLLANSQDSAGRCLAWFREHVVSSLSRRAEWTFDELTTLAATAPAGSGGVVFTPWLVGERSPVDDRRARAGFHNVSLSTTAADLTRAVLEGVAYNGLWLFRGAERFAGRRLDQVRVFGGGTQSDLWCQIVADVFDRPVERVADPLLTGLRGCGLWAGMVLGDVGWDEVHGLVPVDTRFTPDRANRQVYDRLSSELPKLYKSQRGMFRRLNHS